MTSYRLCFALLLLAIVLAACDPGDGPPWGQYQRNGANSASTLVNTQPAQRPAWRATTRAAFFGGPVVGANDRIYVPQPGQGLLALEPDGGTAWNAPLKVVGEGTIIMSTPAVADDGSIYLVTTDYEQSFSILHKVDSNGTEQWAVLLLQATTSSPVVWEDVVFVGAPGHWLFAYDSEGQFLHIAPAGDPCPVTGGFGIGDLLTEFHSWTLPFAVLTELIPSGGEPPPIILQPTIAVVDGDHVRGLERPLIVMPQNCSVLFFEWTGQQLQSLPADILEEVNNLTSAAVSPGGRIVVGDRDGDVRAYLIDASTSPPTVPRQAREDIGEAIRLSPAIAPLATTLETYVATDDRLLILGPNLQIQAEVDLDSPAITPPVISADHVFVGTEEALITFSLDLGTQSINNEVSPWYYRSPAIGADGSLYVGDGDGLTAFPAP